MHKSIAAIQPLSRSYFKMIELWDLLGLTATATAHSAEGPGGFLEAIQDRTGHTTPMIAMTLRSTERTIPGWRKSQAFLTTHPQVLITYGADTTGNLYSLANQDSFAATAATHLPSGKADLYTADGGFDFSADFNGQENTVQRLLIAEVLAGMSTLRIGGTMIIKMFDTKNRSTLEILWLLSTCFEQTALIKPSTSRPANSERYWIGRGMREISPWTLTLLRTLTAMEAPEGWNRIFATEPWPASWLEGIITFQQQIERNQYNKIQLTLNLIRSPSRTQIHDLLLDNIRLSRAWCVRHRIPQNRIYDGLTDEQVVSQNLEEALVPFQVSGARTSLPASSRPLQTHRVLISAPPQSPQAGPAWRSALPASVLGRAPSRTDGGTGPSTQPAPSQSPQVIAHVP
jgi:hypothetical protein